MPAKKVDVVAGRAVSDGNGETVTIEFGEFEPFEEVPEGKDPADYPKFKSASSVDLGVEAARDLAESLNAAVAQAQTDAATTADRATAA